MSNKNEFIKHMANQVAYLQLNDRRVCNERVNTGGSV